MALTLDMRAADFEPRFRALLGDFDRFRCFHGHLQAPRERVRDGWNDCNVSATSPYGKALTVYEAAQVHSVTACNPGYLLGK